MGAFDSKIFNVEKTDYVNTSLFLGQDPGLFDTLNKRYPKIWKLYKSMKSLDWDENEFDYKSCNVEFKTCPKSVYDIMIKTLAWQWEADSVASRTIAAVVPAFISSSELWAAWQRVSDNEVVHAATYSEIVKMSFDNPEETLAEILSVTESLQRLSSVANIMARAYEVSHKLALGLIEKDSDEAYDAVLLFTVAMLVLERIQFMASFAVTFAIADTGMFVPIGKAVQKIAQDELEVHVELDKAILENELKTARGAASFIRCRAQIQALIDEVLYSEFTWVDYLFSEGRELVGLNADLLKKWVAFCARDVYHFLDLKAPMPLPAKLPLMYMGNWLNIGKTQPSPQEEDVGQYRVGVMRRNDEDVEFDVNF